MADKPTEKLPLKPEEIVLYAWIGPDDHGPGLGLKMVQSWIGITPMVNVKFENANNEQFQEASQALADVIGAEMVLCEFRFTRVVNRKVPAARPKPPGTHN